MLDLYFSLCRLASRGLRRVFLSPSGHARSWGVGVAARGEGGLDEVPLDKNIRPSTVTHGSAGLMLPPARLSRQEAEITKEQRNADHNPSHRGFTVVRTRRGEQPSHYRQAQHQFDRCGPRVLGAFDPLVLARTYCTADGIRP